MFALRPVDVLDVAFLAVDTRRHPMHVAGLLVCEPPPDAGSDFVGELYADMLRFTVAVGPFDRQLRWSRVWPCWASTPTLRLGDHVRRLTIAAPGGEREQAEVVSQLHRTRLDRRRPLWEVWLIDGLAGGRFAIYAKFHHSLVDGVGAIRILQEALSRDPAERAMPPIWAAQRASLRRHDVVRRPAGPVAVAKQVGAAVTASFRRARWTRPYTAPRSILNTAISAERRIGTASFEIERLRRIAVASDATLNDVLLVVCAGALRKYLAGLGELPAHPLIATVPVSVRREDAADRRRGTGNAISFAFVSLATDIADPRERTTRIIASARAAKEQLTRIPPDALDTYTVLTMARFTAMQAAGMGARGRPMFNVAISNLAGPREPLYYNGASVQAIYPVSILQSGQALNISALSYAGQLMMTFTACDARLPQIERLADHCADTLAALEADSL